MRAQTCKTVTTLLLATARRVEAPVFCIVQLLESTASFRENVVGKLEFHADVAVTVNYEQEVLEVVKPRSAAPQKRIEPGLLAESSAHAPAMTSQSSCRSCYTPLTVTSLRPKTHCCSRKTHVHFRAVPISCLRTKIEQSN